LSKRTAWVVYMPRMW